MQLETKHNTVTTIHHNAITNSHDNFKVIIFIKLPKTIMTVKIKHK